MVGVIKLKEPIMIGSFCVIDKIMATVILKYGKMYCWPGGGENSMTGNDKVYLNG